MSKKPVYIEKKTEKDPALNFSLLREQGIELLQKLSGRTWTDFNTHDPGVTILEQLCFAITDLAYRTESPIEDILADMHGRIDRADNAFFKKEAILTTNPVTINDFRKAILDDLVDEVENVQLEPLLSAYASEYTKGLYKIVVQVNEAAADKMKADPQYEASVAERVQNAFLSRRNLNEDCVRAIKILKPLNITIRADIIINEHVLPEEVLATIYNKIDHALSPHIRRYTEQELLDKGLGIEQIYCGPLLKHGIIPDSELKPLKKEIDPSEIIKAVSQVEGVLYVKSLLINGDEATGLGKPYVLPEDSFPLLVIEPKKLQIKLFTDKYELNIKESVFFNLFSKLHELSHKRLTIAKDGNDAQIKKGTYRNLEEYESLQNYFPVVYGIGKDGLSEYETEERKARARQLKAYLVFFEQVLANYLAQLANISKLFSPDPGGKASTYFYQHLYNVPGISEILKPFTDHATEQLASDWKAFTEDGNNQYMQILRTEQETNSEYKERKNRIFDHLLARFNKSLSEYPVVLYNSLYGSNDFEKRSDMILKWKAGILRNITQTDRDRIKSFNYRQKGTYVSGFEKKMLALLNIQEHREKLLSHVFTENKVQLSPGVKTQAEPKAELAAEPGEQDQEADLNIFLTRSNMEAMSRKGELHHHEHGAEDAYVFRNQTLDVLKYGIRIANYRIGPDLSNPSQMAILYKAPGNKKWKAISRHPSQELAMRALNRLIRSLKNISLKSEGFYMVEHLLLRPEVNQEAFGFKFYAAKDEVLFENGNWLSFEDRELAIAALIAEAKKDPSEAPVSTPYTYKVHRRHGGPVMIKASDIHHGEKFSAEAEFRQLCDNLALFEGTQKSFYPCFEMTAKLSAQHIIREDFFNFRMTVVFPSWPARFQDPDFRRFTEDLLRLNAPAHLRLEFRWLGLSNTKKFEELYFSWLDMFSNSTPYGERSQLAEKLITFLKSDQFNA